MSFLYAALVLLAILFIWYQSTRIRSYQVVVFLLTDVKQKLKIYLHNSLAPDLSSTSKLFSSFVARRLKFWLCLWFCVCDSIDAWLFQTEFEPILWPNENDPFWFQWSCWCCSHVLHMHAGISIHILISMFCPPDFKTKHHHQFRQP